MRCCRSRTPPHGACTRRCGRSGTETWADEASDKHRTRAVRGRSPGSGVGGHSARVVSPRYSDAHEADPEWRSLRIDADVVSPRHGRQCRSLETATASATTFSRSLLPRGRGAPKNVTRLWQRAANLTIATSVASGQPHAAVVIGASALDASYFTVPDESALARNLTPTTASDSANAVAPTP